jgi:hypothetical protein
MEPPPIRQCEMPSLRPKVEDGPAPARAGGKAEVIGTGPIWLLVARITGPVPLILMSSAPGKSSSLWFLGIVSQSLHQLAILPPPDVPLVVFAPSPG